MINMRRAIATLMRPTLKRSHGIAIKYHSLTAGVTVDVIATPGSTSATAETQEGMIYSEIVRDLKIDIRDLPFQPQRDDEVTEVDGNGVTQNYLVLKVGGSREVEPDVFNVYHTIHLKKVHGPSSDQVAIGNADGAAYGSREGVAYGSSDR